jgi:hypothetical protein
VLSGLLDHCRSVLATRQLDVASAIWATERLQPPRRTLRGFPDVEIVTGRGAVSAFLADCRKTPSISAFRLHTQPVPDGGPLLEADAALVRKGVELRSVFALSGGLSAAQQQYISVTTGLGAFVRLAAVVPVDMIIIDRHVVVLPADPDLPGAALVVIRSAAWAHVAEVLAEACWEGACADAGTVRTRAAVAAAN